MTHDMKSFYMVRLSWLGLKKDLTHTHTHTVLFFTHLCRKIGVLRFKKILNLNDLSTNTLTRQITNTATPPCAHIHIQLTHIAEMA